MVLQKVLYHWASSQLSNVLNIRSFLKVRILTQGLRGHCPLAALMVMSCTVQSHVSIPRYRAESSGRPFHTPSPQRAKSQRFSLLWAKEKAGLTEAEATPVVSKTQQVYRGRLEKLDEGTDMQLERKNNLEHSIALLDSYGSQFIWNSYQRGFWMCLAQRNDQCQRQQMCLSHCPKSYTLHTFLLPCPTYTGQLSCVKTF